MAIPTVTKLEPSSGPPGTVVVITGTEFTLDTQDVKFGTVSCGTNFTALEETCVVAIVPPGSGSVSVYVTTDGGTNTVTQTFTYAAEEGGSGSAPTATDLNPSTSANIYGEGGDSVVITGTNFTTAWNVTFGGTAAIFVVNSGTQITATSPPGLGVVDVQVFTDFGSCTCSEQFTYPTVNAPTITSVSPNQGLPGTSVVITGTNFETANNVAFGDAKEYDAQYAVLSATQIVAIVPEGVANGTQTHVWVQTDYGWSGDPGAAIHFTYTGTVGPETTATGLQPNTLTGWTTTTPVSVSLSATDAYGPGISATYYRVDGGSWTKYTAAFNVSGNGSHLVEYYSVSLNGRQEGVKRGYVNIVATKVPQGLAVTAGIGVLHYTWDALPMPFVTYQVFIDTTSTPTTLVDVVGGTSFDYKLSGGATGVYCRLKSVDYDGNVSGYSSVVGPTVSLLSVAGDITDRAITQSKMALTIRPPILAASAPSLPDTEYPIGSVYYNTTDHHLYKTNDGTTWVKLIDAGDILANTITAGEIAAGAIGADELAANSVFAKNLVVADFENLVQNANSEFDTTGKDLAYNSADIEFRGVDTTYYYRGTKSRRRIGSGTGTMNTIALCDPVPCAAGDRFRLSSMSRMSTTEASYGCRIQIVGMNASLGDVENGLSTYNGSTTWGAQALEYTVSGATVVYVQPRLCVNATVGYYGYFDDILFRKAMSGLLIVDGTLKAEAISGGVINGGDITVEKVLNLSTGGVIRTGASGQRVQIDNSVYDSVQLFSNHSGETSPAVLASYDLVGAAAEALLRGAVISGSDSAELRLMTFDNERNRRIRLIALDGDIYLEGRLSPRAGSRWSTDYMVPNVATFLDDTSRFGELECAQVLAAPTIATYFAGQHPGVVDFTSASTANSGYRQYTNVNSLSPSLGAFDWITLVFRCPTCNANTRMFFGASDNLAVGAPTAGDRAAILRVDNTTLKGQAANGTSVYNTGTTYTITAGTWYRAMVGLKYNACTFILMSESDGVLWSQDLAYGPGTNAPLYMFWQFFTLTAQAVNILSVDWFGWDLYARDR